MGVDHRGGDDYRGGEERDDNSVSSKDYRIGGAMVSYASKKGKEKRVDQSMG